MTARNGSFEARLRDGLADLAPGEAPGALRAAIDRIPDRVGQPGRVARLLEGRFGTIAAAALIGSAAVAVLGIGLGPIRIGPEAGGVSPLPTFDPNAEGPGVVNGVLETLVIVPGIVLVVGFLVALRTFTQARGALGPRGWLTVAAAVCAATLAWSLAQHPGPAFGTGWYGPILGYTVAHDPRPGNDSETVFYATAPAGEPAVFGITLSNRGPLPIRLEGVVEHVNDADVIAMRWTQLALVPTPDEMGSNRLEELVPFTPRTIAPEEFLDIYFVARTSRCAIGPTFDPATSEPTAFAGGGQVTVAYSVLGLAATAPLDLPIQIVEPLKENCPS